MSDPLTISEMCVEYGVTARTLRFYEAKELLFPIREGQRRLFTKRDQARLKLIIKGKRFGFSLEEIRQLLDLYDMGDQQQTQLVKTYELAKERLKQLESQIWRINVLDHYTFVTTVYSRFIQRYKAFLAFLGV